MNWFWTFGTAPITPFLYWKRSGRMCFQFCVCNFALFDSKLESFENDVQRGVTRKRSHLKTNRFNWKSENGVIRKRSHSLSISKRARTKDKKTDGNGVKGSLCFHSDERELAGEMGTVQENAKMD